MSGNKPLMKSETTGGNSQSPPVVSVIIPFYNVEDYLEQCLKSVVDQTLSDIEIICIDDGSTDNSPNILNEFAKRDDRIIVIRKEHSNAGDARNEGLKIARGKYLAFVDADDYAEPNMLENAYAKAEEQSADIVWFRCRLYDHFLREYIECPWTLRENEMPAKRPFSSKESSKKIFNMGSCTPWDKLYRRSFISENNIMFQSITTSNDMVFTFGSLAMADRITILSDVLYNQRINHLKKLSSNVLSIISNYYNALVALREFLSTRGIYDIFVQSFKNWAVDFSLWNYNRFKEPILHQLIGQKLRNNQLLDLEINQMSEPDFYIRDQYVKVRDLFKKRKRERGKSRNVNPAVSVIVPVYNVEDAIERCLNGLMAQSFENIEIICVNDASTDLSEKIISDYSKKDGRIVTVKNSEFKGHGYSVNQGVKVAKGKYITIVEPSDLIDEKMLGKMYSKAIENNIDILWSDICKLKYDKFGNAQEVSMMPGHFKDDCDKVIDFRYERVWKDYCKVPWGALIRRRLILDNDIKYNEDEDAPVIDESFAMKVNISASRAMCISNTLYYDVMKSCIFSGYSMMEYLR